MAQTVADSTRRSVTLSDVASRAGVSLNTASRVLNGQVKGTYPKAQKRFERIQRIAAELGYRANTAARATASGKFHAAGLLFRDDGGRVGSSLVYGVNTALLEQGYRLVLSPLRQGDAADAHRAALHELSVDGFLINLLHDPAEEILTALQKTQSPCVFINAKLDQNSIRPDDARIVRSLVEQLIERGHRRIAYLARDHRTARHYSAIERFDSYRNSVIEHGLKPRWYLEQQFDTTICCDAILEFFAVFGADRPTAVVCGNDAIAYSLLYAAAIRGVSVPDELSVAAVLDDDKDIAGIGLSGLAVPFEEMGEVAAKLLLTQLGDGLSFESRLLAGRVVAGSTIGPPQAL